MKLLATTALVLTASFAFADEAPSEETVTMITAKLAEMNCEMDTDDIEVEDDGYELDDVFCADGQYDINMDKDLNVTGKRKE